MTRVACFPCSGIPLEGKGHRKGRSFPNFAVHGDRSPMALDDLCHNVQPHAQTRDHSLLGTSSPIEPLKNLVVLLSRDAEAMLVHRAGSHLRARSHLHLTRLALASLLDLLTL